MKNKNRLEIRLDPESQALLDSLVVRTSLTKTSIIKNALKVYASTLKNGHIYTVKIKGSNVKPETTGIDDVQNEEINYDVYNELEESRKEREKELEKSKDLPF